MDLDLDPGGPKTCGSGSGFGSATLESSNMIVVDLPPRRTLSLNWKSCRNKKKYVNLLIYFW
jgi:hypothetical protein